MISRIFIDRPVFAWVIAIVVMLAGLGAITTLSVEQYPDIAPPQVNIRATYPVSSGTSFTAGYLNLRHTYSFYVTAINSAGEGPASTTAQAVSTIPPPAAPTGRGSGSTGS